MLHILVLNRQLDNCIYLFFIGSSGLDIPISSVLVTATLTFLTPSLVCTDRSVDDGLEQRGRPGGSAWLGRDQVWTGETPIAHSGLPLEPLGTPKGSHPVFTSAMPNTPQSVIWTTPFMYTPWCHHDNYIYMYFFFDNFTLKYVKMNNCWTRHKYAKVS